MCLYFFRFFVFHLPLPNSFRITWNLNNIVESIQYVSIKDSFRILVTKSIDLRSINWFEELEDKIIKVFKMEREEKSLRIFFSVRIESNQNFVSFFFAIRNFSLFGLDAKKKSLIFFLFLL